MSHDSVSSTASRIRQFGLYRTIDARAEDFIKSSRRKQIRQGCACAAISTAITVTVVVSVILVYEYSIHSTLNKTLSTLPRWFEMKKDNFATETNLKYRFDKKIDFHAATFELLPILFNALNKDVFGNNIREERSTTSSPYKEKNEPEINFQRKIFTDAKNWFKMPLLKRNADDYKLTSLVYPKHASQYSHYLKNIRKKYTEDRLLKYFDKMLINDKASKSKAYTSAYYIDYGYTDDPLKSSDNTAKNKTNPMILNTQFKSKKRKMESIRFNKPKKFSKNIYINQPRKENKHCTCPKNTGALLNKLIQSIHNMVPTMPYRLNKTKSESHMKKVTIETTSPSQPVTTLAIITTHPTLLDLLKFVSFTDPTDTKRMVKPIDQKNITKPSKENLAAKEDVIKKLLDSFKQALMSTSRPIRHTTIAPKHKIKINQIKLLPKPLSTIETNTTNVTTYLAYTPPRYNTTVILTKFMNLTPSKHNTSRKVTPFLPKISTTADKVTHMTSTTNTVITSSVLKLCDNFPEASVRAVQNSLINDEAERYNKVQDTSAIHTNINNKNDSEGLLKFILLANKDLHSYVSTEHSEWKTTTQDYKEAIVSLLSDKEYDDYFQSTPQANTEFENFDSHAFELLKVKNMIPSIVNKKSNNEITNIVNKLSSNNTFAYNDNLEDTDTFISLNLPETNEYDIPGSVSRSDYENAAASNLIFSKIKPPEPWRERLNKLHMLRKFSETEDINLLPPKKGQRTFEISDDDDDQGDWKQKSDDTSTTFNETNMDDNSFEDNKKSFSNDWNRGKNYVENLMYPIIRPPYLDIQQSEELKPRESTDYDVNLANNNIFDLPNI